MDEQNGGGGEAEEVVEIGESASSLSAKLAAVTGLALMSLAAVSLIATQERSHPVASVQAPAHQAAEGYRR